MLESYTIITSEATGEITEKKSKFIASIAPVYSEEEAIKFIEKIKKKHYDARHNCFAFSVGEQMPLLRFSDDGEPQGTAGKPILEVINGSGITNICVVVTRYFGGTLLGTGGLVRAYTDVTKEAIANCERKIMKRVMPIVIDTNYTDMGKIQYILSTDGVCIDNIDFAENVVIRAYPLVSEANKVIKEIVEATSARANITRLDEIYI